MIFVTVGTHEQPQDRLLKEIDAIARRQRIKDKFVVQTGYTKYRPEQYEYYDFLSFDQMMAFYKDARIIITHGGPSSIIQSIQVGLIPIVVPRNPAFGEHVDDHQIKFATFLAAQGKVITVLDIDELEQTILDYNEKTEISKKWGDGDIDAKITSFCNELEQRILDMTQK